MDFCKAVWSVTKMNFRRWKSDRRIWLIFVFVGLLLIKELRGVTAYGLDSGTQCTAYLFPVLFADSMMSVGTMKMILLLGGMLLLCDAPFLYPNTPYVVIRSRRENWWIGESLYIFITILMYLMFILLVSTLVILPVATFGEEWGSMIQDFLKGTDSGSLIEIKNSYEIYCLWPGKSIGYYYPLGAHLYTFVHVFAALFLLGLLQYAVNLMSKSKFWGFASACIFIFLDPFLYYFSSQPTFRKVLMLSPVSWINAEQLNLVDTNNVLSIPYVVSMFVILIVVMLIIIRSISKKVMIEVRGEV